MGRLSNHLITAAYKADLRTPMRKAVMVLLADKASDDGSGIWASKQTMADELCCSKQAVITTIKAFIDEGLLIEAGHRKSATGYTNCYAISIAALRQLELVKCHKENEARGSTRLTGQPPLPVNEDYGRGQPPLPKPSLNPVPPVSPNGDTPPAANDDALKPEHVVEAWNDTADRVGLAKVVRLTDARRKRLRTMIAQHPPDDFATALDALERSPFCRGEKSDWKADFDFFLQTKSFTKLLEGAYG